MSRLHSASTIEQQHLDIRDPKAVKAFAAELVARGLSDDYVLLRLTSRGMTDSQAREALDAVRKVRKQAPRRRGMRKFTSGLLICLAGIVVTAGSYQLAAASREGGVVVVAYGAIIWGAVQAIIGLVQILSSAERPGA
ncbi:MAG: hypothetical protein PHU85_00805 [Phycisphaerae bacterium]|nr:hypothetical protein [Phycisphaerae bacterium]